MAEKQISVTYLSQGKIETGGYFHELFFYRSVVNYLSKKQPVLNNEYRLKRSFEGLWNYIKLSWWYLVSAKADINIVPVRGAFPALFRNFIFRNKVFVVLHSNVQPYSSGLLQQYYKWFLICCKIFKPAHVYIVTISDYWQKYFIENTGRSTDSILLFPNFFDVTYYQHYQTGNKAKRIHLGMNEPKTDSSVFKLAEALTAHGYSCYFSTLDQSKQLHHPHYDVIYFADSDDYLKAMASSLYTIQFPSIKEGWSRIAHESILVGTPVIGFGKAGLLDLLSESGNFIVTSFNDALTIILKEQKPHTKDDFIHRYDISRVNVYLDKMNLF